MSGTAGGQEHYPHGWSAAQIKEYVEALLTEKDRALSMADDEREKAASALRGEQQRALDQASREREKAADNLRIELVRSQNEGDERLREHISNQIMQIRGALDSAEKLETERIAVIARQVEAVARELKLINDASEKAIAKADSANEKRFESVNEWRGQSADRERTQQEAVASLAATYMPREVADAKFKEQAVALADIRSRLDVGPADLHALQKRADTQQGRQQGIGVSANVIAGVAGLLLTVIGLVTAVYFATH